MRRIAGIGVIAALLCAPASAQPREFRPEPLSRFENELLAQARSDGDVYQDEDRPTADNNARGMILKGGDAAIVNLAVSGRKYGVSIDGDGEVLVKNFSFVGRRSKDQFGSGLLISAKQPTTRPTWVSNAWIDLKERGPVTDYKLANNEAVTIEQGGETVNIRKAVLIGGAESGLDNKGDVVMDAVFIASGHRSVRIWSGASLVLVNSIVLAHPGHTGFWFGGGDRPTRLSYYNCRFGKVGDREEDLVSELPDWMVAMDDDAPVKLDVKRLKHDPLDRDERSFWTPAKAPVPAGYLR